MIPLKFVKFQSVNTLTIFIGGNLGENDKTVIHRYDFLDKLMRFCLISHNTSLSKFILYQPPILRLSTRSL